MLLKYYLTLQRRFAYSDSKVNSADHFEELFKYYTVFVI